MKSFGGLHVVHDVSVSFEAGKITALIGPNGAGKTTLFHLIAGALRPDSGEVIHNGQRIDGLPVWEIARSGIGRLFQDVRVFGRMTVLENVLIGFPGQNGESLAGALLSRGRVAHQEAEHRAKAEGLLARMQLDRYATAAAAALSYGQQKLLACARLLAGGADTLLLDEPAAGLNPEALAQLQKILRQLAEEGKTMVVIEHNMSTILEICDWVNFIDEGQIVAFGLPSEVLGDPGIRATYLGI